MAAWMHEGLKLPIPCLTLDSTQHFGTPQRYSGTALILWISWSSKVKLNSLIEKERMEGEEEDKQSAILSPLIRTEIWIYNMIKLNMKTSPTSMEKYLWRVSIVTFKCCFFSGRSQSKYINFKMMANFTYRIRILVITIKKLLYYPQI